MIHSARVSVMRKKREGAGVRKGEGIILKINLTAIVRRHYYVYPFFFNCFLNAIEWLSDIFKLLDVL